MLQTQNSAFAKQFLSVPKVSAENADMVTLQFTPFFNTPPIYFNTPPRCRLSTIRLHSTVSKTATPIIAYDFMADFLLDSLGFSRAEAISASIEISHLKSTKKPELVLKCFEKYGLDKTQIRKIVFYSPKVLTHKVDQTLEPKIKVLLEDNGFSGPDLVKLIKKNPCYFRRGLDTCILPMVRYLKLVMCDDEKVVEAIREKPWLLSSPSALRRMQRNVEMLRNHGLSIENIRKFIIENPRGLLLKPKSIEDAISRVDNELEIPLDSARFYDGVRAFASVSKETLEKKSAIFRSFGWTDVDIMKMGKKQPYSLLMSEDKIRDVLNFFMKELAYPPEYLASHSSMLRGSLDKRIKPRYEVWKLLRDNKVVDSPGFYWFLCLPESTFLGKFLLRYKEEMPDLYEIYTNAQKL